MKLIKYLFLFLIYELSLGGGGRLLEFKGVSLRVFLLVLALVSTVTFLLNKRIPKKIFDTPLRIMFFWILLNFIALFIGLLNHDFNFSLAFIDTKGQMLFLLIPFFTFVLYFFDDAKRVIKNVFIYNGVIIASIQLILLALLLFQILPYQQTYNYLYDTNEVIFRDFPLFFYKGLIYSAFSVPFLIIFRPKFYLLFLLIIFLAIGLSLTRGIILTVLIGLFLTWVYMIKSNSKLFKFLFFMTIISSLILTYANDFYQMFFSHKTISDNQRIEDFIYVINNIEVGNLLWGNGLGSLINGRVNIENSFLWIFFKYGLIGLFLWFLMIFHLFRIMHKTMKIEEYKKISISFTISLYMLIIQSLTNPFINNTIGLTVVIIILVYFKSLLYNYNNTSLKYIK